MGKPWHQRTGKRLVSETPGRRKLHMRKRKERVERIVRLITAIGVVIITWLKEMETLRQSAA